MHVWHLSSSSSTIFFVKYYYVHGFLSPTGFHTLVSFFLLSPVHPVPVPVSEPAQCFVCFFTGVPVKGRRLSKSKVTPHTRACSLFNSVLLVVTESCIVPIPCQSLLMSRYSVFRVQYSLCSVFLVFGFWCQSSLCGCIVIHSNAWFWSRGGSLSCVFLSSCFLTRRQSLGRDSLKGRGGS